MAGPAGVPTLLRYAARCGVKASASGAARHAGLLKHLFGGSAPDAIVRALSEAGAGGRLGDIGAHFFSFGGVETTARWAREPRPPGRFCSIQGRLRRLARLRVSIAHLILSSHGHRPPPPPVHRLPLYLSSPAQSGRSGAKTAAVTVSSFRGRRAAASPEITYTPQPWIWIPGSQLGFVAPGMIKRCTT